MSGAGGRGPDARPLAGRRILITRPGEGAARMGKMLEELGARALIAPTIGIREPEDWAPLDAAIRAVQTYDFIVFTSANGPEYLAKRLRNSGLSPRTLPLKGSLLAIGPATAAAVERHLRKTPDEVARKHAAEGIIALLQDKKMRGRRVLLPRAEEGRDAIPGALREAGAVVDDVAAYRTTPVGREALRGVRGTLDAGKIDMLTFASPSALDGFVRAAGENSAGKWMRRARVASIGPATTAAARKWGVAPDVEAAESTIPGMTRAIVSFYRESERGEPRGGSGTQSPRMPAPIPPLVVSRKGKRSR